MSFEEGQGDSRSFVLSSFLSSLCTLMQMPFSLAQAFFLLQTTRAWTSAPLCSTPFWRCTLQA